MDEGVSMLSIIHDRLVNMKTMIETISFDFKAVVEGLNPHTNYQTFNTSLINPINKNMIIHPILPHQIMESIVYTSPKGTSPPISFIPTPQGFEFTETLSPSNHMIPTSPLVVEGEIFTKPVNSITHSPSSSKENGFSGGVNIFTVTSSSETHTPLKQMETEFIPPLYTNERGDIPLNSTHSYNIESEMKPVITKTKPKRVGRPKKVGSANKITKKTKVKLNKPYSPLLNERNGVSVDNSSEIISSNTLLPNTVERDLSSISLGDPFIFFDFDSNAKR